MTEVSPPPSDPAPADVRPRGRRRRLAWNWTRRLLAVGVAVGAAVFVAFFSIDLGQFGGLKTLAEREGSKWLEHPLHIGRIVAYVAPGDFGVDDVMIEGLRPTDRPFFRARHIRVHINWVNLLTKRELNLEVKMTGWEVFIETWGGGRNNMPRFKHDQNDSKPKPFTTTLQFMDAPDGAFGFEDHSTPWSVVAPNLHFNIVRSLNQYLGTASFAKGTVQIQHFLPMATDFSTRFTLDGPRVVLRHIDLVTDGARTHVNGTVDFANWPEQRYNIESELDFRRMRELFFANETWDVDGTGRFAGIFHVYNGGQELAGNFSSDLARVNGLEFPELHGSLVWFPDRFEVTHADADFAGGRTRFTYAIEPLGQPTGATQRFTAELDDASLARIAALGKFQRLLPVGRVTHAHATMAWPSGKFKSDVRGSVEADVDPPEAVTLAPAQLPPTAPAGAGALTKTTTFDPVRPLGPLPTGGHLVFDFDGTGVTFADSWVATPTTHFDFTGRSNYGADSTIVFHAASLDWQESDRLLAAIMTAAGSSTGAVELGGRGTFDGVMTQRFSDPRIEGTFSGDAIEAFRVRWGKVTGHAVIHDRYIDVSNGVIGDQPDEASIRTSGRFSLGFPRADHGEEVRAHVTIQNWPLALLRHAFGLDDWPVDGTIATADADLFGPYTGLFGSGRLQLTDGVAWKEHFQVATGDLTLNGTGVSIDRISMSKGDGRITGAALVKWTDGTYSFDARGTDIKVETLDNFKLEKAPLTGILTFTATGAGAFSAPHYEFGGTIKDLYAADEFVGEVTGHLRVDEKRMTIDQFNTSSFRLQVTGSGQILLDDQYDAELTLRFLNTSIDPYLRFFAPRASPYTRAIASGSIRISGPLSDYGHLSVTASDVTGTLTLFDYQLHNDGPLSVTYRNGDVRIGRFRLTGEGTNLEVTGGAKIDTAASENSTIDVEAKGDANLAIIQGPNMRGTGRAVVQASAIGRLSDPSISGYADVDGGSFRYRALPRSFTDLRGRVTFDGNSVNLNPSSCPEGQTQCGLKGKFGDGDVTFGGSILLKQYLPDRFDLTANGTAMRLRYPEGFSSTVNADLTLTGPVASPLLAGRVDVLYASYNQTIDTEAGIVALLAAAGTSPGTLPGEAGGPLAESGYPLSFNIDIRANRTLHIDNKRTATIVGSADLSYRGTLDRPSLTGHIDIDSGEVFINGNRFKVLPSTIQFSNPTRFDPYFDVTMETHPRAGGETFNIGVHVTGALHAAPTVSFTSDPYLNQVDIITLILGGVPDVGSAEQRSRQSQQQAYTMLMQTAAAQLLMAPLSSRVGSVFEKTNLLDTMQVTTVLPNENSFQQLSPSTRVTIGKRLSPQLYLTYARDLNSSQYEVILVEYEESDKISWILARNQDQTFSLDFRIRHVF